MSRYNPNHKPARIYDLVDEWKRESLISDRSLLVAGEICWDAETISTVNTAFNGNPDNGPDPFLDKLRRQISGLGDRAVQFVAEALYVMLLFPANITGGKKRQNIEAIMSWRDQAATVRRDAFAPERLGGIGSAGGGYNQNRPFEFGYFLSMLSELKSLPVADRKDVLSEPWRFSTFLTRINAPGRQLSHILEHLLFPDTFERISSGADKRRVILGLTDDDPKVVKAMDRAARDRRLLKLREQIAQQRGDPQFDFYEPEFRQRWRPDEDPSEVSIDTAALDTASVWIEVTSLEHGHGGPGWELGQWLWSPTTSKDGADRYSVMRLPKPGDVVFHFVAGLAHADPGRRFLWGRSIIDRVAEEVTDRPTAPGTWGEANAYYRLALRDLEQLDSPRPLQAFEAEHRDLILRDLAQRPKHYPYAPYGDGFRGAQGIYLAKATEALAAVLQAQFEKTSVERPGPAPAETAFSFDDAMQGLFLDRDEVANMLELWRAKSNIILQGAPGVGKSFLAKRLAFALIGARSKARVQMVQFHQSYAYEDFIQGYRPTPDRGFVLKDGIFLRHCQAASEDPERNYVLIIDEINRGNLSKIFGEAMLLIEHDKRGSDWEARLTYGREDEMFFVPKNLFIIGMMNTADRSLSLVDYALRRRFAFVTLKPRFEAPAFREHLLGRGVAATVIDRVITSMSELNSVIASDTANLGAGFEIGHSFFVPHDRADYGHSWCERAMRTEIIPLLEEYWFDDPKRVEQWRERLLQPQ